MSVKDSIQGGIWGGIDATKRAAKATAKKAELSNVKRQQGEAFQNLGRVLYESTTSDQTLRAKHIGFYEAVEGLNAKIIELEKEIAELENPVSPVPAAPMPNADSSAVNLINCLSCGSKVSYDYNICTSCGTNLAESKAAFVKCSNCARIMSTDNKFCIGCGSSVVIADTSEEPVSEPTADAPTPAVCSNCKTPIKQGNKFCAACGTKAEDVA